MRLGLRDYFTGISLFGVFMSLDGFSLLYGSPMYELIGGAQVIIGMGIILFGLVFLHFSADFNPGLVDKLLDQFMQRLKLSSS